VLEKILILLLSKGILSIFKCHTDIKRTEVFHDIIKRIASSDLKAFGLDKVTVVESFPIEADELQEKLGATARHTSFSKEI
jgi:hypothetical protein